MTEQSWLPGVLIKLESLRDLKPNWDSYGADPPNPKAIDRATKFAEFLSEKGIGEPHVAPCNDGCIAFEWTGVCELEVDINAAGTFAYLLGDKDEGATGDWQGIVGMLQKGYR